MPSFVDGISQRGGVSQVGLAVQGLAARLFNGLQRRGRTFSRTAAKQRTLAWDRRAMWHAIARPMPRAPPAMTCTPQGRNGLKPGDGRSIGETRCTSRCPPRSGSRRGYRARARPARRRQERAIQPRPLLPADRSWRRLVGAVPAPPLWRTRLPPPARGAALQPASWPARRALPASAAARAAGPASPRPAPARAAGSTPLVSACRSRRASGTAASDCARPARKMTSAASPQAWAIRAPPPGRYPAVLRSTARGERIHAEP